MPRKYNRKDGVKARVIAWTAEQLQQAFDEIERKTLGINAIARKYGIPSRTLRRRYADKNKSQLTLGKHPTLGFENEKRLVKHILKLREAGFPSNRRAIRILAYQFAEKLKLKHNFDHETQMAGESWFENFIERNPEVAVRQAEGLSLARAKGLCRERVKVFYELFAKALADNDLFDKPERIYNMDESGVQLNNKPVKVIAKKGSKVVNSVKCAEKGETMTIVACCNATGNFLPPVVIIKGVIKKTEFEEGLPPGSKVYMNKNSADVNTELFYKWLTEHFIPLKPRGKVVLILDGHSSHSTAPDMLQLNAPQDPQPQQTPKLKQLQRQQLMVTAGPSTAGPGTQRVRDLAAESDVNSDSKVASKPKPALRDPLSGEEAQCRFCGEHCKDLIYAVGRPYLQRKKANIALNDMSVDIDFNDDSLPNTVCLGCDRKLLDIFSFVNHVKTVQESLVVMSDNVIEEAETLVVKIENPSPTPEDDITKPIDSITFSETEFVKHINVPTKRKSDNIEAQKTKVRKEDSARKTDVTAKKRSDIDMQEKDKVTEELIIEIKKEIDEMDVDDLDEAENSESSNTETDVIPRQEQLKTLSVNELSSDPLSSEQ